MQFEMSKKICWSGAQLIRQTGYLVRLFESLEHVQRTQDRLSEAVAPLGLRFTPSERKALLQDDVSGSEIGVWHLLDWRWQHSYRGKHGYVYDPGGVSWPETLVALIWHSAEVERSRVLCRSLLCRVVARHGVCLLKVFVVDHQCLCSVSRIE